MSWQEVLEALERSLCEAEQCLAGDVWERPAPLWNPPPVPLPPLSPPEAARLHELSARCDLLRWRLEAAMAGISVQLDGTRRLRQGAHGYLMTQNLPASR